MQPLAELVDELWRNTYTKSFKRALENKATNDSPSGKARPSFSTELDEAEKALQLAMGMSSTVVATLNTANFESDHRSLQPAVSPGEELTMNLKIHNDSQYEIDVEGVFVDPGNSSSAEAGYSAG